MAGPDRIEIEQVGRTLVGTGSLRVSLATKRAGGAPAVPYVDGVVTFSGRVTFSELETMDSAEVRISLARGARHVFRQAVVMEQEADPYRARTYTLQLDCYEVVS